MYVHMTTEYVKFLIPFTGTSNELSPQAKEDHHPWGRREGVHVPSEGRGGPQDGPKDRAGQF